MHFVCGQPRLRPHTNVPTPPCSYQELLEDGDDDHGDGQVIEVGNGDCEAGSDVILQATLLTQY